MRCTKTNQAISEQKDYVSYGDVILPAPLKPVLGSRSVSLDLLGWKFLQPLKKTPSNSTAFENNPSQDFEEFYPALNFTAFSKNYLPVILTDAP